MNRKIWIVFSAIICGLVKVNEGANILAVMPLPFPSHFKAFQPLLEALIERGDNVTIVAGLKLNDKFQSKYISVDVKPIFRHMKVVFAEMRKLNPLQLLKFWHDNFHDYTEKILEFTDVQTIINSDSKYDLIIAQGFVIDSIFAFGYKFDAPVINVHAFPGLIPNYNWILGNPFPSSYIPNIFLPFAEKMSLPARIVNLAYDFLTVLFYEFITLPRCQTQIERYFNFNKETVPHIKDIMKNVSVTFVNSHYLFGYVRPDLPNVVNVAGIHFTPSKILPENIQKFMDEAESGVIYLSMGTLIEPDKIENLGKIFIRVMENLPQRVIMKWKANLLPYIPKNFFVQPWIPQTDVLNHPKCRLLISHGGFHSQLESLNASVPLVGIPFFGDQKHNMVKAEYFEIGVAVDIDNVANELELKINEVLYNPKYKKNIAKRSKFFQESLNKPMETALYWIDHVIKHKDTSHLRSAATQLTWYELYSVDVLIIVVAIFWVTIKLAEFIIRKSIWKLISLKNVLFSRTQYYWFNEKRNDNLKCD